MSGLEKVFNRLAEFSFYGLFFLTPLILTPFNFELFEFNKMMLVYLFTILIAAAWLGKMIHHRRFLFKLSFWDLPLILFLASQILATIFSLNPHTSLWGYYSRSHQGLFSTLSFVLLYWALINLTPVLNQTTRSPFWPKLLKKKTKKPFLANCLFFILFSGFLVALYGIAERFGIDARYWVQDVQSRVFSTLGQPNWLAAYLAILFPLAMAFYWLLNQKKSAPQKKLLGLFYLFLIFLCLLYTKSRSGFLGFGTAFLGFVFLVWERLKKNIFFLKPFLALAGLLLVVSLLIGTPFTPGLNQWLSPKAARPVPDATIENFGQGTQSSQIRKIVWQGALEVWQNWPLFGSGVETFAYSYYNFRPRAHNDVSEWDFLYNKAHNEYLNFLTTTGIVGLVTYLILVLSFPIWAFWQIKNEKKEENKILLSAFLAAFLGILVTNFFGFSVVTISLFLFLLPALSVSLTRKAPKVFPSPKKTAFLQKSGIMIVFLGAGFLFFTLGKFWWADVLFAKGDKKNSTQEFSPAYPFLQQAVQIRPGEPTFRSALSLTTAHLAKAAFLANEATLSGQLVQKTIDESNLTLKQNPVHLNFWKNRVRAFYLLAEIDEKYYQQVLDSLNQAAKLAPTDAKIFYNLALVYAQLDQKEKAIQTLKEAIALKPNYDQARFALALFYEENGEIQKAKEQLQYILEKINPENKDAREKLNKLQKP